MKGLEKQSNRGSSKKTAGNKTVDKKRATKGYGWPKNNTDDWDGGGDKRLKKSKRRRKKRDSQETRQLQNGFPKLTQCRSILKSLLADIF